MSKLRQTSRTAYDAVFFSAHLDDAALSCGNLIASLVKKKQKVLVITLFTADNPRRETTNDLKRFLSQCGGMSSTKLFAIRRREDDLAAAELGCDIEHLGYVDGLWRTHRNNEVPLYPSFAHIFGRTMHPEDTALCDVITAHCRQLIRRHPSADFYAPLGIGRHIDHRITFQTVLAAAQHLKRKVIWYEDVPYRNAPGAREFRLAEVHAELLKNSTANRRIRHTFFRAPEALARRKAAACQVYVTQWPGIQESGFGILDYYQERFFTV